MSSTRVLADPIAKARIVLLTQQPWYGSLALRLIVEPSEDIPTAATDGITMWYNPKWIDTLSMEERVGVFAHESMHCSNLHITRRQSRDPELWNISCDNQVNLQLIANNFKLPMRDKICADPRFKDMAAEQIYAILDKEEKSGQWKRPQSSTWNFGAFIDAPKNAKTHDGKDTRDIETEWKVAVQTATEQARQAGRLPLGAQLTCNRIKESGADWRDVIRRYIVTVGDFSWARPNRRHPEFILPGAVKTRLDWLVIAVDTSGSTMHMLDQMAGELNAILGAADQWPVRVSVVYWDAKVQKVDECEGEIKFTPVGGGGTCFQPTLDWIAKQDQNPDVLVVLTDLEFGDSPKPVDYPVIWVAPEYFIRGSNVPAFGEIVEMGA